MDTSLAGKRAVVTAGASGLGQVIADQLLDEGAMVFVCDIDEAALGRLPSAISSARVDVADWRAVDKWLGPIVSDGVDILVNNAGVAGPTAALEDMEPEDWRRCLAVGLDGQFHCTRCVIPTMKAQQSGAIINISSTAGLLGMPFRAPYVAAKFGVIGLTKTLAMELGRDGVRVNAIAPGSVTGNRMEGVISNQAKAEGISQETVRAMFTQGVSLATFIEPDEIADMVVFLCSQRGRHITGQIMAIDGGTETLYPRPL